MVAMKDLVEYVARRLVDNPDKVDVSQIEQDQTLIIKLRVAKEDIGKVIGKQGRTAKAMRTILNTASAKGQQKVLLEIAE
jgi:predicted RNA-binding protein YlqC (UPF0109 family)